ncbi:MAG TPA: helix-turn-helix domain-containing protein [Pseudolysinimonas sp.]|jgi:excisionase family DNA binding protein|nr:helix-turn-helix domain-containing protein [Pseudolysinimonas sp.]
MTPNTTPAPAPATTASDIVYTVREVAEMLKVSAWTVNKLIRERDLGSIQIGARRLVPTADLEEYLRELRKQGRGVRYGS